MFSARWFLVGSATLPMLSAAVAIEAHSATRCVPRMYTTEQVAQAHAFVVKGIVRDSSTGRPVEAAMVALLRRAGDAHVASISAPSNASGEYSVQVTGVASGATLTIQFRRIGYIGSNRTVVLSGDTTTFDVRLAASMATNAAVTIRADAVALVEKSQVGAATTVSAGSEARGRNYAVAQPMVAPTASPPVMLSKRMAAKRDKATMTDRRYLGASDSTVANEPSSREQYDRINDNPFLAVRGNPRSTFSIDVDRAAYGNVRRFLTQGQKPPADAVRIEEMVNYFPYSLNEPRGKDPIAITTEVASAPWETQHRLVRIALQARRIDMNKLPPNNLVFLIDVSGSMNEETKLPLVKQSLRLLVDQMREQDRVAIVVYAGNAGLVLPSTSGADKSRIAEAIDRLEAGGSTAGGAGIQLAYKVARENFMREGNNRVILATDGDFNVGASSDGEMERLIENKRSEGTYLTVLGFGMGNYQDAKMEKMAKQGNGNYAYIDNIAEARKTLVHELGATLVTVANDVKLQVEFNPTVVSAYRLIGYEDRLLRDEDFNNDKKDAGDIGSGHSVTALYEVVPVGVHGTVKIAGSDSLRYQQNTNKPNATNNSDARSASSVASADFAHTPGTSDEMMYVKLRYKTPGDSTSKLMTKIVPSALSKVRTTDDFRFAASVASFGMLLRDSEYKGTSNGAQILETVRGALGEDVGGYRAEFVRLVERWQDLSRNVAKRD